MSSSPQTRVLIVDDDELQRNELVNMTASLGFAVATAADGEQALEQHASLPADVILTDLMMPRMDGFDLLRTLESSGDRTPTIVLTGVGGVEQGLAVIHDFKAFWFLEKPVQPNILRALLERATAQKHLINETDRLNRQLSHQGILGDIVGGSAVMRQLYSLISQVAPTSASVLITEKWDREGISCARAASPELPVRQLVHCDQLCRHAGNVDRERALWTREGRLHRGRGTTRGML